ncbi:MAG TPA: DUF4893 domain-containing protein [Sphingomicrobium sp.]|jgi:hypothetical protein
MRMPLLLSALFVCSGCNVLEQPSGLIPRWTSAWREVAAPVDRQRLAGWRSTFVKAVAAAKKSGHAQDIAREGALLDPDAALNSPAIPNGDYRCRVIKLGAKTQGMLDYVAYPAFRCRISADRQLQRLDKLTGSQRYVGLIFPGDAVRQVFLGTLVLGDETRAMQYGQDSTRDVAGHLERIGDRRWRLVMPEPRFESQVDVMELVPAA